MFENTKTFRIALIVLMILILMTVQVDFIMMFEPILSKYAIPILRPLYDHYSIVPILLLKLGVSAGLLGGHVFLYRAYQRERKSRHLNRRLSSKQTTASIEA